MLPVIENVSTIEEMMDLIDQPIFLLDVYGEGHFAFRRLNRCHQVTTGLDESAILGATPHEVLPERLADTLVKNYEECRVVGVSHTYEELLELPTGPRWWQTTLSPIKGTSGEVAKIVGLAFDISDRKEKEFSVSRKVAELTRLNEDLQVFAASTTRDMAGPFETIGALLGMVQEGFVDLGDDKVGQLALCQEIVERSIERLGTVLQIAENLKVHNHIPEIIDLHHVASDIAAILDPHTRLNMQLPVGIIETDRVALQMLLRNVMENAVRYADTEVSVTVENDIDGTVGFMISDDGVGRTNLLRCDGTAVLPEIGAIGKEFGLSSTSSIVASRGGRIEQVHSPYLTGAAIKFTLPGRVVPEQSLERAAGL